MIVRWDSPVRLAKSIFRTVRYVLQGRPAIVPPDIRAERYELCQACPSNSGGQCRICTCFVSVKVILSSETCPDNPPRWKKLTFSKPTTTPTTAV